MEQLSRTKEHKPQAWNKSLHLPKDTPEEGHQVTTEMLQLVAVILLSIGSFLMVSNQIHPRKEKDMCLIAMGNSISIGAFLQTFGTVHYKNDLQINVYLEKLREVNYKTVETTLGLIASKGMKSKTINSEANNPQVTCFHLSVGRGL